MTRKTDLVIGGGGLVGLPLALALVRGGLKVTVVDPLPPEAGLSARFDGRVSALSASSVRMFQALGLWDALARDAQPITQMLITDGAPDRATSPFSLHFDGAEDDRLLGHIVENRHLRKVLGEAVAPEKNLTLLAPDAVVGIESDQRSARVRLKSGETIDTSLAIAADGRASPMREAMGLKIVGWSYPQHGIVATVRHASAHNGVAYEHFLPAGPFAILPMTQNRSSLVWTESENATPAMMALNEKDFDAEVARRFGTHLGETKVEGPRWSYPLGFHLARGLVGTRFALVGDAAHNIHPIAGQGLNLGLKDVAALGESILDTARLGLDIGSDHGLQRYQRWRRFDSFAMAAATDGLNRLFSNDIEPVRQLRDLGLGLVDGIAPLRRFFMAEAAGDSGKLPRLLKGEAA